MEKMMQLIKGEEGQSMVEYGLILGLVSVAAVAALTAMKGELGKIFESINTALKGASSGK